MIPGSPSNGCLPGKIAVLFSSLAMKTAWGASPTFSIGLLAIALMAGGIPALAEEAVPSPERQIELIQLIRNDCGSCHGLTLAGGLGPALLPGALRDKPLTGLQQTILQGRPGTPMPPWAQIVSEFEAEWMVRQLMTGLPDVR